MEIILYQPQIPQNAGNIARTCSVTGTELRLVRPLGFSTSNRRLKRAGLDYWEEVSVAYTDDLFSHLSSLENRDFYFFSSRPHLPNFYTIRFKPNDILIFGSETEGISQEFWDKWQEKFYTIPMQKNSRCLNLSNAVSIVLYEGLRQQHFT
jgi:tRNA (cytidine/uridine-2'-O-)-methyltransferase